MATENERELRRQLEEPLNSECRNYPLEESTLLVALLDTPYYPPYVPDTLHYHNCLEIGVCLSGNGRITLCEHTWAFSAGSVVIAPRGVYHCQSNAGDPLTHWRYLVINEDALLRSVPDRYLAVISPFLESIARSGLMLESCGAGSVGALVQQMVDLLRREEGDTRVEQELYVILLLVLLSRESSRPALSLPEQSEHFLRQPIEPALAYVYDHYKEDIHVSELARCCSMSESYFRKQFFRIMGMSPLDYLNQYRIHRSMNLLRTTGDSVQIIAARCGFTSVSAFNRNFKRHALVSPSQWRRSRLNK